MLLFEHSKLDELSVVVNAHISWTSVSSFQINVLRKV